MLRFQSFKTVLYALAIVAAPCILHAEIVNLEKNNFLVDSALRGKSIRQVGGDRYRREKGCGVLRLSHFAGDFIATHNSIGPEGGTSTRIIQSLSFNKHGKGFITFATTAKYSGVPGDIVINRYPENINVEINILDEESGVAVLKIYLPYGITEIDVVVQRSIEDGMVTAFSGVISKYASPLVQAGTTYILDSNYFRKWQN